MVDVVSAISRLRDCNTAVPVLTAATMVPSGPGLYSIFIDTAAALPEPFGLRLTARSTRLLYVGCSETSVAERLLEQDCEHRRASTFFRGIGAVLGYLPEPGSLRGKVNQNNYRFSATDTKTIIRWIRDHLSVCAIAVDLADIAKLEKEVINELRPVLNTTYNPTPLQALADLREKCRGIARA